MEANKKLGEAIASLRKRLKLSQVDLANAIGEGLGQPDISRIERGLQGVSIESLSALAAAMRVPVSEVWREAEALAAGEPDRQSGSPAVDLMATDPGKAASRIANDIDALRYAVGAIVTAITVSRPAEGGLIADGLRAAPQKFLDKEGSIHLLLQAVEAAAHQAKGRAGARRGATPESS